MNKKLFLVALISAFSAISLQAMKKVKQEEYSLIKIPKDAVNQYIREESARGRIGVVGRGQQIQVLPNGKQVLYGRIPYKSGEWINVIAQYNADGTPDESFGPQGLQAE